MLPPIPPQMLRSTITVGACTELDRDRRKIVTPYTVKRVHLQPSASVRKTSANTDVVLRAMLFVDARLSRPALDWEQLLRTAQLYSKEIENDADNVDAILDGAYTHPAFTDDKLLGWLLG